MSCLFFRQVNIVPFLSRHRSFTCNIFPSASQHCPSLASAGIDRSCLERSITDEPERQEPAANEGKRGNSSYLSGRHLAGLTRKARWT